MSTEPQHRKSYSEAMNEWSMAHGARGSFQQRARVSLLMPDAFAHPLAKLFGYLWRLAVLALIGGVVYWLMLRSHLGSAEFSKHLASEVQVLLKADAVKLPPLAWRGDTATIRQFSATGGSDAFFRSLEAENLNFRVPITMLWEKEWNLKRLEASALTVELRSGSLSGANEAAGSAPEPEGLNVPDVSPPNVEFNLEGPPAHQKIEDIRLMKDGMGVSPSLRQVNASLIEAAQFQVGWGTTSSTHGALRNGRKFSMSREGEDRWLLELASAEWSQNWLKGLQVAGLCALITGQAVDFEETAISLGDGTGTLQGRLVLGQSPTFDLTLKMQDFPFNSSLPEPCDKFLTLRAGGELKLGGSPNRATGITVNGRLVPTSGAIMGLPIQQSLAVATGRVRFREWDITGGLITLSTSANRCEAVFDLQSREDITLRGSLLWAENRFSGQLKIGSDPALLQRLDPGVRTRFFTEKAEGKEWLTTPLTGIMEQLTEETAQELMTAHDQAPSQ